MPDPLQPEPILQRRLIDPPWSRPKGLNLPGISPVGADDWLRMDDAYGAQMALRDRLIVERVASVHDLRPAALDPAQELLDDTLDLIAPWSGFERGSDWCQRPDGVRVPLDRNAPLLTLGRLVQEDLCILQPHGDEQVLTGAILCFPASWTLAEKIDRPLIGIHTPVPEYDGDVAARVQRLFHAIRPGRPLMRGNCLLYADPSLYQPRREGAPRVRTGIRADYLRTERQCLLRLARTGAVVFTIHTTVVARKDLTPADQAALAAHKGIETVGGA